MSEQQSEQVQQIVQRYNSDAAFKEQVDTDPIAALRAEGVSKEEIKSTVEALGIELDVAGYYLDPAIFGFDSDSSDSYPPPPAACGGVRG